VSAQPQWEVDALEAAASLSTGRVILDEPGDTYYKRVLGEANNTALTIIDQKTPLHYYDWVTHPDEDEEESAALAFGKAFHCATLEPELFRDTYSVLPANAPRDMRRFRDAKKPSDETLASIDWWDSWEARNAGRVMMTNASYDLAVAMAESLRGYVMEFDSGNGRAVEMTGADLFDSCEKEVTVRWVDEETGLPCKLRADLWNRELRFAGDLKSARDATQEAFSRAINAHRYHVQHAHYCEGFRAAGEALRSFAFFPVEKIRPFAPASWHIDPISEERGWAIRQRSIRKLKACMDSGRWPGPTRTIESIGIPAYGHYDIEETK